jgi:hypothetical protein
MAPPKSYFVTESGAAFKASDILSARFQRPLAIPVPETSPAGEAGLPVVPGGDVVPGALYASANVGAPSLYLPRYRVARDAAGQDVIRLRSMTRTLTVEIDADPPSVGVPAVPMAHTLSAIFVYWLLTPSGQRATEVKVPFSTVTSLGGTRYRLEVVLEDTGGVGRAALAMMKPEQGARIELLAISQIGVPAGKRVIRVKEAMLFDAMGIDLVALRPQLAHFATPATMPEIARAELDPAGPRRPRRPTHGFPAEMRAPRPFRPRPELAEGAVPPPEPAPPELPEVAESPQKRGGALLTNKFRKPTKPIGLIGTLRPMDTLRPIDAGTSVTVPPKLSTAREETTMSLSLTRPRESFAYVYELGGTLLPEGLFLSPVAPLAGSLDDVSLWMDAASQSFYYLPRRFLLARSDLPPFAPGLFAVFGETEPGEEPMVELSLYLLPHLDVADMGRARERARLALGGGALDPRYRFFLQEPSVRELVWQLPAAGSGADSLTRAEGARISFREGIQDTLSIPYSQFKRLLVALMAPQIGKVPGSVTYESPTVPGRGDMLPAVLSLREMAGRAVSCALRGPSASVPFGLAISLQNTIESDVVVRQQVSLRVGDAVYLGALYGAGGQLIADHTRIPAGGSLDASLLPATPSVFLGGLVSDDITIAWQAVPTPEQLRGVLTQVMAAPQFAPVREPLTVETLPDFFGPRGGKKPIRALRVEFQDDAALEVSGGVPSAQVLLRQPFIEALLDEPAARSFRYRVTNLYEEGSVGSPSDWTTWDGGSPLLVAPGPWES